uniref:hypothetical protein n=1 Tax=uncultured Bacteroides sp. TaxID=162156 RepID=UPI0025CD1F87|nr:hypothetical protein [uncultured Bacteroides sp.]
MKSTFNVLFFVKKGQAKNQWQLPYFCPHHSGWCGVVWQAVLIPKWTFNPKFGTVRQVLRTKFIEIFQLSTSIFSEIAQSMSFINSSNLISLFMS